MKRYRNIVIGGIQSKIFTLILVTVLLLSAVNYAVYMHQSRILAGLSSDSAEQQQKAISEITYAVMDEMISQTLQRSNVTESIIADKMFAAAASRVNYAAAYAEELLAHPESYEPAPYTGPDPAQDGIWTGKVIYAIGANAKDPELVSRLGLFANLFDPMINLCRSFGAETIYIALPQGVHMSVSDTSSTWFEDGEIRRYDPRERGWYQQAAGAGHLIFTEGEWDANTGKYCIECAAPVYGPDGSLAAVVGTDLFLDEMQEVLQESDMEGRSQLLVSQRGHAVLAPQAEQFPMDETDREADLRRSENELLASVLNEALQGKETGIRVGMLSDGEYYVTASPIETTGWVLLSAYSQEKTKEPVNLLQERTGQIQTKVVELYREKMRKSRLTATVLLTLAALVMLAGAMVLGRKIVIPLNRVTRKIAELSETNLEFKMEDAFRTGDEVEELAKSFAMVSHRTVGYLDTVRRVTAEKERIGTELSLATQIQASMLPHVVPAFPDRTEFDVYGSMDPAKEVGGDFFDYFLVDEDHLGIVIADVSGKGIPAALFMMASKIILQSVAMMGKTPAEILKKTNEAICSSNEAEMFVTVWLGILEISTGRMTAANAGHEYPVWKRAGGTFELFKDKHGIVLGAMEGVVYKEYELVLEPGSKLFLYTDGIPEATNEEKQMYGMERLISALNNDTEAEPMQIVKNVRASVDDFVEDAEQFDDLTMVCLEYRGKS